MNTVLDITALGSLVVERVASAPQGSQLRAYLLESAGLAQTPNGMADDQIIHAAELDRRKPVRPFIAFRESQSVKFDQVEVIVGMRWWIYDDTERLYKRINNIVTLLGRAYADKPPLQMVRNGVIGNVMASLASGASYDSSLDLNYRYVTLSIVAG